MSDHEDNIRANEMAQAMYEAFPSPRRIDCGEEDFDPVPWDDLRTSTRFAWMTRARNMMRDGWVLARSSSPEGAVAMIVRLTRKAIELAGPLISEHDRLGLAWSDEGYEDDDLDAALRVLVKHYESPSSPGGGSALGAAAGAPPSARETEET